jgi:hypothetical protein
MSGPGYRKWCIDIIRHGSAGHHTSDNNALTRRHGGLEQEACVPWVAGRICCGAGAGQPHPFTGSEAPPGGGALWVRFSGVVSANPLYDR